MRQRPAATITQVRETAESIQVASAEMASGNTDLSQRTEQAAANLQQAAGSLEQLTGTMRQSADAAAEQSSGIGPPPDRPPRRAAHRRWPLRVPKPPPRR